MNLKMQLCLLFLLVVGISCAPHNIMKKSGNFPLVHGDADVSSLTALKPRSKKWHLEPLSVTKISKKRQDERNTVSEVKESHSVLSAVNGNRQGVSQEHQQVSKNGKLLSKIFHQQRNNAENGQEPHMEDMTEVEIPELDIHEKVINNDGLETQVQAKRNSEGSALPPHSAVELAAYVLETGDQASVVQFLETMLEEGKISEEEALVYVETIKSYLEAAEKASEQPDNEEEKIREILLERKLEEEAMEQKMLEEEAAKSELMRSMIKTDQNENESILKINNFLEGSLKEGKMSKSLYNHLKGALIESVVNGMGNDSNVSSLDYAQY